MRDDTDNIPGALAISAALKASPDACGFVIQMPGGERVQPEEVWIEPLGVWVRVDGSHVSADLARGFVSPQGEERVIIADAVEAWRLSATLTLPPSTQAAIPADQERDKTR